MVLLNKNHNKNESKEHYELKQISKYILYSKGYNCIATEVQMPRYNLYLKDYKWFNEKSCYKNIIDVIGVRGNLVNTRDKNLNKYNTMGIESKASYQDFLNGFCCHCDYTYVIAPLNIIPVDKLPDKIGLIEVDLEKYVIGRDRNGKFIFENIKMTKKCLSRKKDNYKDDKYYMINTFNLLRKIAYRNTVNDLFKKNEIEINF